MAARNNLKCSFLALKFLFYDCIDNDDIRLAMLREFLAPSVQSTIADALQDTHRYEEALLRLNEEYRHPILVSEAHIDTLMSLRSIKANDHNGLYEVA